MSLENFELLVSENKGEDLEKIVISLLESNILNIESIIMNRNVQDIKESLEKYYNTLLLFSRNDYVVYNNKKSKYIELTEKMIFKLKELTILKLAAKNKVLNLKDLITILEIKDKFELDEMLFDVINKGWISGKVDHLNQTFYVSELKPRDYIDDWKEVEKRLEKWISKIDKAENIMNNQIQKLVSYSIGVDDYITNNTQTKV